MPVFKNLVELFSNLSPRRKRETEDQRSAARRAQPPPSTPPRSRPAGSSRNPFTLVSDETNLTGTTSPQNAGIAPFQTVCIFPYLHARPADICFWPSIFLFDNSTLHNLLVLRTYLSGSAWFLAASYRQVFDLGLINLIRLVIVMSILFRPQPDLQPQTNHCARVSPTLL